MLCAVVLEDDHKMPGSVNMHRCTHGQTALGTVSLSDWKETGRPDLRLAETDLVWSSLTSQRD